MSFEQLAGTGDSDYYAAGLGAAPLPAYVLAGSGLPAEVAVRRWNTQPWTVNSYNAFLKTTYRTLLNWDRQGWTVGCWSKNPGKRREWSAFMKEFSQRYSWGLVYTYVSADDELLALRFMSKLLYWSNWLNIVCDPRVARASSQMPASLNGLLDTAWCGTRGDLGEFGAIPIILYAMAGSAAAAGATVATWLAKDDWSVGEYNYYMKLMYDTILSWDRVGWDRGCWTAHPDRREMWASFMQQFGALYARGKIADYSFVSDSEEQPARDLMRRLATWGDWLNATCAAHVETSATAPPPSVTPAMGFENALTWGAILLAGGIGYNIYRDMRRA